MKHFIFLTTEGYTYSPNCSNIEPDVENCQVLGFEKGNNAEEAFKNLKINNLFLKDLGFEKVIGHEIVKKSNPKYFNLD
jgi:hypothetical protein